MLPAVDEFDQTKRPNQDALLQQLGAGSAPGMAAPVDPMPAQSMAAPPAAKSPFQSDNKSLSGYLQEAAAHYRPELIKQQGDAARKSSAESFIRSLEPELRARGWNGGDIKNEKLQVDGRWMDLYQDVEGAANPQYADVTDAGPSGPVGGGVSLPGMGGLLGGDPLAGIQSALGQYSQQGDNLKALLAQLGQK